MFRPLKGICAAPLLPMNPDYSIDWDSLKSYIGWIARQHPSGIAMNMGASEGEVLTLEEKLGVIEVCRDAIGGICPFFSGVVVDTLDQAVADARQLVGAGADGLVVFPRIPHKPRQLSDVVDVHRAVAEATNRPLVVFQLPLDFGPDLIPVLRELGEIPQIVAVKEASFDLAHTQRSVQEIAAAQRSIGVLTGTDTHILEVLMMGCDGALIGFAGTATAELVAMNAAVQSRNYATAQAMWDRLGPLARFCWRAPMRDYRPRMKEVLVLQGLISHATVRPPQRGIDDAERAKLRELTLAAGLIGSPNYKTA